MTNQEAMQAALSASALAPVIAQLTASPATLSIFLEMLVQTMQAQRKSREIALVITKLEEASLWLTKVIVNDEDNVPQVQKGA
jgi:hypothetical protein